MIDHIQINDVAPRISYCANGVQSAFTYPFAIFKAEDLEVWLDGNRQSAGFTVSGAGISSGGSVLFAVPPEDGSRVILRRRLGLQRVTDFQADGIIRAKTLNDELDFQVAVAQQLAEEVGRAVKRSLASPSTADLTLPEPAPGKAITWDMAGNGLVNSAASVDEAVAAATIKANEAAASAAATLLAAQSADASETVAVAKAAAALAAQNAAAASEANALTFRNAANASAGAAATSEANALTYRNAANASAGAAATSEANALTYKNAANASAGAAATAESHALAHKDAAQTAATTATTQAAIATNAAGNNARGLALERAPANWMLGEAAYLSLADILGALALPQVGASRVRAVLSAAGTSLTVTADEVVVKAALGSPAAALLGSYSKTLNLAVTGAGGMDTGAAPVSGYVAIYAIAGPAGASILACNLTASAGAVYAGVNCPDGYGMSALLGLWPTNGSGQLVAGVLTDRVFGYAAPVSYALSGVHTGYTALSISTAVPWGARSALVRINIGGNGYTAVSPDGLGDCVLAQAAQDYWVSSKVSLPTMQTLYYKNALASGANIVVTGFGW